MVQLAIPRGSGGSGVVGCKKQTEFKNFTVSATVMIII